MPRKDDREYRSFEIRELASEQADEGCIVEGYATTFDVPYDFYEDIKECVRSTALDGADMSDVIFQLNHTGIVMARIKNGTLQLTPDEHGLHVKADLSGVQAGRDLHEAIKNGLITKMSWGFKVARDGWEYDEDNKISYITKVDKVYDVSAVSLPADEDTEISARSYFQGVMEAEQAAESRQDVDGEELQRMALRLRLAR